VSPLLGWTTSSNAQSYEYCVETSINSSCDGSWLSVGSATKRHAERPHTRTTYQWQARARNGSLTTNADGGGWWTFINLRRAASRHTGAATGIGQYTATLNGTVNPNGINDDHLVRVWSDRVAREFDLPRRRWPDRMCSRSPRLSA